MYPITTLPSLLRPILGGKKRQRHNSRRVFRTEKKIITSKTKPNANKEHQRRRAQAHQVKVTQKQMEAPRLAQQSGKGRTRFA